MQSKKQLDIVRVRIRYLKRKIPLFRRGSILLVSAFFLLFAIKWFIALPQIIKYLETADPQALFIAKVSTFFIAIANVLILISVIFFTIFYGALLRIKYTMLGDISRLVLLFTIFTSAIGAILWLAFGYAIFTNNFDIAFDLRFMILRVNSATEMSISFAILLLIVRFLRLRKIIRNVLKKNEWVIWILLLLVLISFVEPFFLVVVLLYLLKNDSIIYSIAYVDIEISNG